MLLAFQREPNEQVLLRMYWEPQQALSSMCCVLPLCLCVPHYSFCVVPDNSSAVRETFLKREKSNASWNTMRCGSSRWRKDKEYFIDAAVGVGRGSIMSRWRRKAQLVQLFCKLELQNILVTQTIRFASRVQLNSQQGKSVLEGQHCLMSVWGLWADHDKVHTLLESVSYSVLGKSLWTGDRGSMEVFVVLSHVNVDL